MLIKFLASMKNLSKSLCIISFILFVSCTNLNGDREKLHNVSHVYCTKEDLGKNAKEIYEVGDLICARNKLVISNNERIEIHFVITNKNASNIYEYGYQELRRFRDGHLIERLKLRRDSDAYWSLTPFVRLRNKQYFADLDQDGNLEFAIFPFSPGSAIWGTVRIFSLKDKISFWGEGRYQFEGDTFVQLNCMKCSKFNLDVCNSCE